MYVYCLYMNVCNTRLDCQNNYGVVYDPVAGLYLCVKSVRFFLYFRFPSCNRLRTDTWTVFCPLKVTVVSLGTSITKFTTKLPRSWNLVKTIFVQIKMFWRKRLICLLGSDIYSLCTYLKNCVIHVIFSNLSIFCPKMTLIINYYTNNRCILT